MRTIALKRGADQPSPDAADQFAREVSELSYKYGIAINDSPTVFVMEPTDYSLAYHVDRESRLKFQ